MVISIFIVEIFENTICENLDFRYYKNVFSAKTQIGIESGGERGG